MLKNKRRQESPVPLLIFLLIYSIIYPFHRPAEVLPLSHHTLHVAFNPSSLGFHLSFIQCCRPGEKSFQGHHPAVPSLCMSCVLLPLPFVLRGHRMRLDDQPQTPSRPEKSTLFRGIHRARRQLRVQPTRPPRPPRAATESGRALIHQ